MILYRITHRMSGMRYVGVTSRSLAARWREHLRDAKGGRGWALHDAIRAYGEHAFDVEQVAEATDWQSACQIEQRLIAELNSLVPNGFNLTPGGEGALGRPVKPETRAKISAARKGKPLSVEHRAKLSVAKEGRPMPPRTDEHRRRISQGLVRAHARRKAAA